MGLSTLIIGESGSGKSTSLRNLDPRRTVVFSTLGKGLPFRGSRKNYTVFNRESNPTGNMILTSSSAVICQWLKVISERRPEITTVVVDDNTFVTAKELDRRRGEVGYTKFNDIAHDFLVISELANTLREDLNVYFLHHVKVEGDGILDTKMVKAMSYGKLTDEKLGSIEAQFEIVLLACKIAKDDGSIEYKFRTRDVNSTCKSPIGLFEEEFIDNDLNLVNKAIEVFYNEVEE